MRLFDEKHSNITAHKVNQYYREVHHEVAFLKHHHVTIYHQMLIACGMEPHNVHNHTNHIPVVRRI
jgi:hypothetical protein